VSTESKAILYANLRVTSEGDIKGKVAHGENSLDVLEALAVLVETFADTCEVSPEEICDDIKIVISKGRQISH